MIAVSTTPILIVDDYNTMIRILRNLLRQLGFSNIDEANDGAAALAKMRAKPYALVISDAHMSPMSGYELLKHMQADERLGATPFMMVANDNDEVLDAAVPHRIVRPISAQALKAQIEPVLGPF